MAVVKQPILHESLEFDYVRYAGKPVAIAVAH